MNNRTAYKIVRRIEGNPAFFFGYTPDQVSEAFRMSGDTASPALAAWKSNRANRNTPKTTTVQVGIMRATIDAGDDGVLGTADDQVKVTPAGASFTSMNMAELKAAAKEAGHKGYSKLNKGELVSLLEG